MIYMFISFGIILIIVWLLWLAAKKIQLERDKQITMIILDDILNGFDRDVTKRERNKIMTNQEKFIEVFGIDVWRKLIYSSEITKEFKDFWTSKYDNMLGTLYLYNIKSPTLSVGVERRLLWQ